MSSVDDPAKLIEEARAHKQGSHENQFDHRCATCGNLWPCLPARLAEVLEGSQRGLMAARRRAEDAERDIDAARADAAAQRERADSVQALVNQLFDQVECVQPAGRWWISKGRAESWSATMQMLFVAGAGSWGPMPAPQPAARGDV